MIQTLEEFAEEYSQFIKRLILKELPRQRPDGTPFYQREYMELAKITVINKLFHLQDGLEDR